MVRPSVTVAVLAVLCLTLLTSPGSVEGKKVKAQHLGQDYQIKLRVEKFADRAGGVQWITQVLSDIGARLPALDLKVNLTAGVETIFHEERYDTENNAFANNFIVVRVRNFTEGAEAGTGEMSFKFNSLDGQYARNAPCSCAQSFLEDGSCKRKLEQDVHQNFVKTACTSKISGLPSNFAPQTVKELAGYFDGVTRFVGVDPTHKLKLWEKAKANNYFWRVEDIPLVVGGVDLQATLKLRYDNAEDCHTGAKAPADGEFKFKVKGPKVDSGEAYPAKLLGQATTLYITMLAEKSLNVEYGDTPCRFGWGPGYIVDDTYQAIDW